MSDFPTIEVRGKPVVAKYKWGFPDDHGCAGMATIQANTKSEARARFKESGTYLPAGVTIVKLALALIALLIPSAAFGQCGSSYGTSYRSCYPTIVQEVVPVVTQVAVFQAVPVFVPAYSASHVPGYGAAVPAAAPQVAATPTAANADLTAILRKLEAMDARLQRLEKPGAAPVPLPNRPEADVPGPRPTLAQFFTQRCAQCHTDAGAARLKAAGEKELPTVMFTDARGALLTLTPAVKLDILKRVSKPSGAPGAMPRQPKDGTKIPETTDQEYAFLVERLTEE